MQQQTSTPYEIYCHHCRVTFALGTKSCIHCGGRLARRDAGAGMRTPPAEAFEPTPVGEIFEPGNDPEAELAEGKTSGRFRLPISPVTLLWLVLIVGSVAQRACNGG
jgi:hypothetical protein